MPGKSIVMWSLLVLGAGCGSDDLYLMSEKYELKGAERVFAGGGCVVAIERGGGRSSSASGGSGIAGGDFVVGERSDGDGVSVVVRSGAQELARREYGADFLSAQEVDRFQVTTLAGRRYELAYWGGPECDTSHLPRD